VGPGHSCGQQPQQLSFTVQGAAAVPYASCPGGGF
jgi:hypothetical protein